VVDVVLAIEEWNVWGKSFAFVGEDDLETLFCEVASEGLLHSRHTIPIGEPKGFGVIELNPDCVRSCIFNLEEAENCWGLMLWHFESIGLVANQCNNGGVDARRFVCDRRS